MFICIYIYIYIYIYMGAALSPLLFDHLAIYKTSWRAGETIEVVYNYAKTHTITHVYCRRETLGIICPIFPTFCKESLGIIFPTFPTFCKESTGYPALDPTANKYLSGSGWEIYVFLFV